MRVSMQFTFRRLLTSGILLAADSENLSRLHRRGDDPRQQRETRARCSKRRNYSLQSIV